MKLKKLEKMRKIRIKQTSKRMDNLKDKESNKEENNLNLQIKKEKKKMKILNEQVQFLDNLKFLALDNKIQLLALLTHEKILLPTLYPEVKPKDLEI
jgi:hypothetical protein